MKIVNFFALIVISSITACSTSENFTQCRSNEHLEKTVEALAQKISQNQEIMTQLLSQLQAERKEKNNEYQKAKKENERKIQQTIQQQKEEEIFLEWFKNLPWYKRHSINIITTTTPWITNELLPIIKSIITHLVAQKITEYVLSSTDFVCGDIPQAILPKSIGTTFSFRPGEFLKLSSEQRKSSAALRKLNSDSEFKRMQKEIRTLEEALAPDLKITHAFQHLHKLKKQQALINLKSSKKYMNFLNALSQLELEMNTFTHLKDLIDAINSLKRTKEDILNHSRPSTSSTENVSSSTEISNA